MTISYAPRPYAVAASPVPANAAKRARTWLRRRCILSSVDRNGITHLTVFIPDGWSAESIIALTKAALKADDTWQFAHTRYRIINAST
jgi:hypothetical protein